MGHCPPVLRRHIFDPLLSELCKPRAFQSYIRTEEQPAIGDGLQAGRKRAHEDAAKAYGESRRSCVSRSTLWTTKRACHLPTYGVATRLTLARRSLAAPHSLRHV